VKTAVELVTEERLTSVFVPEAGAVRTALKEALDGMRPSVAVHGVIPVRHATIRTFPIRVAPWNCPRLRGANEVGNGVPAYSRGWSVTPSKPRAASATVALSRRRQRHARF
jgi:hypothetical protein